LPPAKIGRLFWFVSVPLERRFGHRTLTHSALALAVPRVAGTHWYALDLTATDNLTLQPVQGRFPWSASGKTA
ncbi:MAG: hypothetical protein RKP73_05075, partial [Candidatus Contendobacter sp.]|nr:hypothetical protein [Candidatus Contendobacter sp.]